MQVPLQSVTWMKRARAVLSEGRQTEGTQLRGALTGRSRTGRMFCGSGGQSSGYLLCQLVGAPGVHVLTWVVVTRA